MTLTARFRHHAAFSELSSAARYADATFFHGCAEACAATLFADSRADARRHD